jgi:hypothetical protein
MAKAKSTAVAHCCPRCAKLFTGRRKTGRWCSWRCYDADHSQAQICDHCGKTFGRRQLRRHQGVFCSPACYYAHPHRPLPPRRTLSLSEKVWPKVEQRGHGECWPWHGARNKNGQGHLLRGGRGSRFVSCSRAIYEITHGEVPADSTYVTPVISPVVATLITYSLHHTATTCSIWRASSDRRAVA